MEGFTGAGTQARCLGRDPKRSDMDNQPLRPELIVGLVCPLGARIDVLTKTISDQLRTFGYESVLIRVSDGLKKCRTNVPEPPANNEGLRIRARQEQALEMRSGKEDVLARMAIAAIRVARAEVTKDPDKPRPACAYIVRQLKHPNEAALFRRVYGSSFVLIAGSAPKPLLERAVAERLAADKGEADYEKFKAEAAELIAIDEQESEDREWADKGQSTRDTFPLADYFVDLTKDAESVKRFVNLLFGHPFETPTQEEMAMQQAATVSYRSSEERRQVGAVIVKRTDRASEEADADVVASGMNEVPRRGGGSYWRGEYVDARDPQLFKSFKTTRENALKRGVVTEIAMRLQDAKWLQEPYASMGADELGGHTRELLDKSQLTDIGEFSRQVHAEMAAIVDAAKRGVSVLGSEMYVTTFPCHNCAKHIIAAGVTKVVYLEPYPKSRATKLFEEEITTDPKGDHDKVVFVPFTGVAPRQFSRLFSMAARGKKGYIAQDEWEREQLSLTPRHIPSYSALTYTHSEIDELDQLPQEFELDKAARPLHVRRLR